MSQQQDLLTTLLRLAIWTLALAFGYFVLEYALPVSAEVAGQVFSALLPFIIGALVALFIEPVVTRISKRLGLSRGLATFISLIIFLGLITFGLTVIISRLVVELIKISATLPSPQRFGEFFSSWVDAAAPYYAVIHSSPEVMSTLQNGMAEILMGVKSMMVSGSNYLLDVLAALPGFFTILIFSLIASFFLSRDKGLILDGIYRLVPAGRAVQIRQVLVDLGKAFMGFIRAQTILISITGLITIAGLSLLGVEYAFTVGVLTGLLDLLPIVGPGLIMVPWVGWELIMGKYTLAAQLAIVYGVLVLVRQLIEPKVVADSIGLHPLATLISLYVGMKTFGVAGIIIGPSVVLLVISMYRAGVFPQRHVR
ncbi:MAG: sporulation integral membrane protein YtvI [Heliobacteriaceae bacterium]|nr:sporulation integral membrane protein YtvI [Heliobacteriaceae bacterium]MDD4587243.1 sporulation integral membrane protein YtvI [Heliobacteriaceae bacterium]